jgi:hypothetical protein
MIFAIDELNAVVMALIKTATDNTIQWEIQLIPFVKLKMLLLPRCNYINTDGTNGQVLMTNGTGSNFMGGSLLVLILRYNFWI